MEIDRTRTKAKGGSRPGLRIGVAALALLLTLAVSYGPEWVARQAASYSILCRLAKGPKFERVVLSGSAASGTVLDGGGDFFNEGKFTEILIRSEKRGEGAWDRPTDIVIENGKLRGSIRVMGMGRNGEAREVTRSSRREGHTERAQAAAPTRITIRNVEIEAAGTIPLYLSPGATEVRIENCTLRGWTTSVALYLDAESGRNVIRGNVFDLKVGRELIAVDGSAENRIEDNRLNAVSLGGIYLYRNCGEGGTVRHQPPRENVIVGNTLDLRPLSWGAAGIWLGSRNGNRTYCHADDGYPFGSSVDNGDFAQGNVVTGNRFTPAPKRAIRDNGEDNRVERVTNAEGTGLVASP